MVDRALQRRLLGEQDSRGPVGIFSRGKNVYNGASSSAHIGGGPQFGRPREKVQTKNVQSNLQAGNPFQDLVNMDPKPIDLTGAIQRRLLGGRSGY